MKSNSTAKIYTDYTFRVSNNETWIPYSHFITSFTNPDSPTKLTITANPSSFTGKTNNVKVVFTITAKSDAKGIYPLYLDYYCNAIPVVVGLDESEVNSTILKGMITTASGCAIPPENAPETNLIGYSGVTSNSVTIHDNNTMTITLIKQLEIQDSPLKQFRSGIAANDVICNTGFALVLKAKDNSPACIKIGNEIRLVVRGWANTNTKYNGGVLVQSGTQFFIDKGETKSFGPFVFNDTVKINGEILSPLNAAAVYICQSIIVHPSNQSAPLCTGKNDFVSGQQDRFYFGCYYKESSDGVLCMPDGLTLPAGKYTILFYTSYPASIIFRSDLVASPKVWSVIDVIIPPDSEDQTSGLNFTPQNATVVIGINNTVHWINKALIQNTIDADNHHDMLFYKILHENSLAPNESFNFTFTNPGVFGYHVESHPWLHGWITVLPPNR